MGYIEPPPALSQRSFWSFQLTRTSACLLSLVGPVLLVFPFLLIVVAASALGINAENGKFVVVFVIFFASVLAVRIYFARWYVLDKGRHSAWALVALFGIWGWVVLWSLDEQNSLTPAIASTTQRMRAS